MMTYPKNYAPLAEEELEYTVGGFSINWWGLGSTAAGLGTSLLAYLNIANIAAISVELQRAYPDQYPEPEGTINGNLLLDSLKIYFTSLQGIALGAVNVAAAVGTVYLGLKADS